MTKNTKVTLESKITLNSITYAQLYLEQRIKHCKANGRDNSQYKQELDEINKTVISLQPKILPVCCIKFPTA